MAKHYSLLLTLHYQFHMKTIRLADLSNCTTQYYQQNEDTGDRSCRYDQAL